MAMLYQNPRLYAHVAEALTFLNPNRSDLDFANLQINYYPVSEGMREKMPELCDARGNARGDV
jgi:hypothetical protein